MTGEERLQLEELLDRYRPLLRQLAESELPAALKTKVDPSDLVQETLLRGFRDFLHYRGTTDAEFVAWMQEILRNHAVDVGRHFGRALRNVQREVPLISCPPADGKTVSDQLDLSERGVRLQNALAQLPEDYRTVLLLRQFQHLSFPEIALQMKRTPDAVRMLWGRALLQLGKLLKSHE